MRKSRYTDEQNTGFIKHADAVRERGRAAPQRRLQQRHVSSRTCSASPANPQLQFIDQRVALRI